MIQTIVGYIVAALHGVYPAITVYTEQVREGLAQPCFIVTCVSPQKKPLVGRRYRQMNAFSVQYISGKATAWKDDCYSVAEKLFEALEYVGGDSELIRGTEMNVNFADEIMTFTVNYNVFMISEPEPEDNQMKTLDIENYAR